MSQIKNNLIKHILILVCALFINKSFAQDKIEHKIQTFTSIEIYNKLKLRGNNSKNFHSHFAPSAKIGTNYSFYYKNLLGFSSGIGLTIVPHIFRINQTLYYDFWSQEQSYYANEVISRYLHYAYTVPINIEKRLFLKNKHYINFSLGAEIYFILNFPYTISTYSEIGQIQAPLFEYQISNSKSKVLVAYTAKIGYFRTFKNQHGFGVNFLFAYSPQILGLGTFKVHDKYKPQEGTIKWDINHIGFEFIYSFRPITRMKKRKAPNSIKF